jgi:hypothetical protein
VEKANKMSLLGIECPVCGELDFKIHRTIDDCISFVDSEIQRLESGATIMLPMFSPVMVVRLRWVRGLLGSVKEGKEKMLRRTLEGMVEYQFPKEQIMLDTRNETSATKKNSCQ